MGIFKEDGHVDTEKAVEHPETVLLDSEFRYHVASCEECFDAFTFAAFDKLTQARKLFGFTDEEFEKTDQSPYSIENENVLVRNQAVMMQHVHGDDSSGHLEIKVRETYQLVNAEGFAEETPRQVTLIVPVTMLKEFTRDLMINADHLLGEALWEDDENE